MSSTDPAQRLYIKVSTPKGVDNSGKISGAVSYVENSTCNIAPPLQTWKRLTDCMGVNTRIKFNGVDPGVRYTLGLTRAWVAPNKCWRANGYGRKGTPPVAFTTECTGSW